MNQPSYTSYLQGEKMVQLYPQASKFPLRIPYGVADFVKLGAAFDELFHDTWIHTHPTPANLGCSSTCSSTIGGYRTLRPSLA
ncbi:hypothetical protein CCP3SC15_410013 [Gammaproteobacteria bacterium]